MSGRTALLLDLGDTLVVEEPAAVAACVATAEWAATQRELVLVTNGASCLQREKLDASGLREGFAAVVVSAEVRVGKRTPRSSGTRSHGSTPTRRAR